MKSIVAETVVETMPVLPEEAAEVSLEGDLQASNRLEVPNVDLGDVHRAAPKSNCHVGREWRHSGKRRVVKW